MQLSRLRWGTLFISCFSLMIFNITQGISSADFSNSDASPVIFSIQVLDLSTAAKIALSDSPTIAAARERILQSKERLSQVRSTYWPRLDVSASASRVTLSDSLYDNQLTQARFFNPGADVVDPEDYYRASISLTWRVFDGFSRKLSNIAASYGLDQSELARMDTKRLLLFLTAQTYYAAQLALENLSIADADEAFNLRQLSEAQARHRVGTGSLSDVLNFQIRANSARAERIRTKQAYEAVLYSLAAVLGIPTATLPTHIKLAPLQAETDGELKTPNPEPLIAYANTHRPDIIRSEIKLKQMENSVELARAGYYPSIDFMASIDGSRYGDAGFEGEDFGNTVALSLTYNLFSGGLTRAQIREAKNKLKEVSHSLADAKLNLSSQVLSALANLKSAQKQVTLQRNNAQLVQKHRNLVEKEYLAGQGSLVRLNEAQRDLITIQSRLSLALVSLRMAWFSLNTETARILEVFPG